MNTNHSQDFTTNWLKMLWGMLLLILPILFLYSIFKGNDLSRVTPEPISEEVTRMVETKFFGAYTKEHLQQARWKIIDNDIASFQRMYDMGYIIKLPTHAEYRVIDFELVTYITKIRIKGTDTEIWVNPEVINSSK